MSFLSFLGSAQVEQISGPSRKGGGRAKQWTPNPTLLAIRLWRDGSVFPSKAAIDKFDLEYRNCSITKVPLPLKEGQTESDQKYKNEYTFSAGPGNGFDVIDSRVWANYKADGHMLFISPVSKDEPKVDLFARVDYEDDGTPKNKVEEQGSATFGKDVLLAAVEELYGIKLTEELGKDYVDLVIFDEFDGINITEKFSTPVMLAPKRVVRGADKGKPDYIRRENALVYGLVPAQILGIGVEAAEDQTNSEEELTSPGTDTNVEEALQA